MTISPCLGVTLPPPEREQQPQTNPGHPLRRPSPDPAIASAAGGLQRLTAPAPARAHAAARARACAHSHHSAAPSTAAPSPRAVLSPRVHARCTLPVQSRAAGPDRRDPRSPRLLPAAVRLRPPRPTTPQARPFARHRPPGGATLPRRRARLPRRSFRLSAGRRRRALQASLVPSASLSRTRISPLPPDRNRIAPPPSRGSTTSSSPRVSTPLPSAKPCSVTANPSCCSSTFAACSGKLRRSALAGVPSGLAASPPPPRQLRSSGAKRVKRTIDQSRESKATGRIPVRCASTSAPVNSRFEGPSQSPMGTASALRSEPCASSPDRSQIIAPPRPILFT